MKQLYFSPIIETEEENERAIALAEKLSHRQNRTLEESLFLNLLIALIEKYEDKHYPIEDSTPNSMLLHLMEARNLEAADLVNILGSKKIVSDIMEEKRKISQEQAQKLADFFHVNSSLLVEC
ncbi:MAG: type II toxin-antitoxin system HigA family antitoxin [Spirulina sp.]